MGVWGAWKEQILGQKLCSAQGAVGQGVSEASDKDSCHLPPPHCLNLVQIPSACPRTIATAAP